MGAGRVDALPPDLEGGKHSQLAFTKPFSEKVCHDISVHVVFIEDGAETGMIPGKSMATGFANKTTDPVFAHQAFPGEFTNNTSRWP